MYLLVKYVHRAEDMIFPFVIIVGMLAFAPLYDFADKRLPHNRFCNVILILCVPFYIDIQESSIR